MSAARLAGHLGSATRVSGQRALVIGAGQNGMVAAVRLADAGWDVTVLEAAARPGGALRTEKGPLPGFRHDRCAGFFAPAQLLRLRRRQALGLARVDIDLARPVPKRRRRDAELARELRNCGTVLPLLLSSATASRRNSNEYG